MPRNLNLMKLIEENTFTAEICAREKMSKMLSKFIAVFDYVDKTLLVLSATSGSVSIDLFAPVISAPVGLTSASLSSVFFVSNGIAKNF